MQRDGEISLLYCFSPTSTKCIFLFLEPGSHTWFRESIPVFGVTFLFCLHLAGFSLVLQRKPSFIWRLKTSSVCIALAPRRNTECRFSQSRDGYWVNTTDKYNNGRLDTCIIARAIRYACRHTPHLKHCRQQESFAACQPWLMWSISKPGEIHQGKLLRERLAKTLLPRTRMWLIFMHFFPHLSPDPPRCFVSQELWAISLMRKLILQQPHPAP